MKWYTRFYYHIFHFFCFFCPINH